MLSQSDDTPLANLGMPVEIAKQKLREDPATQEIADSLAHNAHPLKMV